MADVNDMIVHIAKGDLGKAQGVFDEVMADRQAARIDQEKVAVSANVFNPGDELDDMADDLEAELDDIESEEEEVEEPEPDNEDAD